MAENLDAAELERSEAAYALGADAVSRIVTARFGADVTIGGHRFLHNEGPVVASVDLDGAPVSSVVVKFAPRDADGALAADSPAAWQLANERATLSFLTELSASAADKALPVPECYGGDADAGVVVMADLGPGDSLAEVLLRRDGTTDSGSAAERALDGYIDAIARIHLATFGVGDRYRAHRATFGPVPAADPLHANALWADWRELSDALNVECAPDVEQAAQTVVDLVEHPGDWEVVSLKDLCPDNNRVMDDGSVWLFDAQYSGAHHGLIDVAYLHATMPTCWCVRELPTALADRLVARYVGTLKAAGRDVGTDFDQQLALCRTYMALWRGAGSAKRALADDGDHKPYWDTYDFTFISHRQQIAFRCGQLEASAALHPQLEPMAEWARRLHAAIVSRWPSSAPLPLYPAFS